jgi:hypothetical protein
VYLGSRPAFLIIVKGGIDILDWLGLALGISWITLGMLERCIPRLRIYWMFNDSCFLGRPTVQFLFEIDDFGQEGEGGKSPLRPCTKNQFFFEIDKKGLPLRSSSQAGSRRIRGGPIGEASLPRA